MTVTLTEPIVATPAVTERDVLHRAADLLEEFGWCQGKVGAKEVGELCALGAVWAAAEDLTGDWAHHLGDAAGRTLSESVGEGSDYTGAATWNDDPERTRAEVVAALRQAAEGASA